MTIKQLEEMKTMNLISEFDYKAIKTLLDTREMVNSQIKIRCKGYDILYKELKNDSKQVNEES